MVPEFEDEKNKFKKEDFPWLYPPISHPDTILCIGFRENFIKINLKRVKKKKQQSYDIEVIIPQVEVMVEP